MSFTDFIDKIPFYGTAVLCLDNEPLQEIIPRIKKRYRTYGTSAQADFRAKDIQHQGLSSCFTVEKNGDVLGTIQLNLPGAHNVLNALASVAVGMELGIGFSQIKDALETVEGVQRRMEIKGEKAGITVVDDYGHHPTEIKATLTGARKAWPGRRLVVIFQPHRHTRTAALFQEFTRAFYESDLLFVLDIYAAGEQPVSDITAKDLHESIREHGHKNAVYLEDNPAKAIAQELKAGDVVLTLGAGDVWKVGMEILELLA